MATPKLLHLRSTVQGKLPAAGAIQVGQIGVNYNAADPFLCIKDSAGVVRRVGSVSLTSTAPASPQTGQLWVDTTTAGAPVLKLWDGSKWVVASGGTKSGSVAPTPAVAGDVWVDLSGTAPVMKVYNGVTWNPVDTHAPQASTTVAGIAQWATAADVTSGASDRVITADLLKTAITGATYTLPAATAKALGGIKVGTNLSVTADGTLSANIAGALTYAGTLDATTTAPAAPRTNGLYVSSKAGTVDASFTGASGSTAIGDWFLYDGAKWDMVQASAVVGDATASTKGIVQLADAAAITAGTAGRVVDAAQLKVVNDAIATATGGGITGITGTAPITATGTGATRTIAIDAATTTAAGSMSAADKTKLDGITAGAEPNIQADWSQADNTKDDFIKNKPTIPTAYTLPKATTTTLGGVIAGSGLSVKSDGTLSVSVSGALVFKGAKDPTAAPPASPSTGDVYVFNKAGTVHAGWTGIGGQSVSLHEVVAWDGAEWALFGAVGSTGVTAVTATAPLSATGTSSIALTVGDASTTAKGVIEIATDAEATAGTSEVLAVNPKQLKAVAASAATITTAGIVQLADPIAITAGTAGRVVDAAQLKVVNDKVSDASTTAKGVVQLATGAEVTTGTDTKKVITPATLKAYVAGALTDASETAKGIVELATSAEVTAGTDTTRVVTPAGLKVELDKKADLANPTLTGTPSAPTPAAGTNNTQIATTAFVHTAVPVATTTSPKMDGTAAVGTETKWAKGDHVHPHDTSRAPLASPTFTGTPKAPTPATTVNNTQLATTAFVHSGFLAKNISTLTVLP